MGFRREHPVFRRRRWFRGREIFGATKDIGWFTVEGNEMTKEEWDAGFAKTIGVLINGDELPDPGPRGERITDDSFLLLFNAHHEELPFTIPEGRLGNVWGVLIDTSKPDLDEDAVDFKSGEQVPVGARSVVVLKRRR